LKKKLYLRKLDKKREKMPEIYEYFGLVKKWIKFFLLKSKIKVVHVKAKINKEDMINIGIYQNSKSIK